MDFVVEPTKFRRGAVQVYRLILKNDRATLVDRHVHIPPDAEEVDLCACPDASDEEIREALNFEPAPPPPKPAPKPVEYRRITREEDPNSSRLGFTCGGTESRAITVGSKWTYFAFHLSTNHIVSRLDVSLSVSAFCSQRLEVRL